MTVITTASVNTATATSTYPPAPSCSKIAPYIPAVSIGWPCTVPTVPTRDRNSRTHRADRLRMLRRTCLRRCSAIRFFTSATRFSVSYIHAKPPL